MNETEQTVTHDTGLRRAKPALARSEAFEAWNKDRKTRRHEDVYTPGPLIPVLLGFNLVVLVWAVLTWLL